MKFYDSLEDFVKENPNIVYRVWDKKYYDSETCEKYIISKIIKLENDYMIEFVDPYSETQFDYRVWYQLSDIHIEITDYDLENHDED